MPSIRLGSKPGDRKTLLKRAAIVHDFDGTLSKGNVQEHSSLPSLEIKKSSFWRDVRNVAKGTTLTRRATKSNGGAGRLRVLGQSGLICGLFGSGRDCPVTKSVVSARCHFIRCPNSPILLEH